MMKRSLTFRSVWFLCTLLFVVVLFSCKKDKEPEPDPVVDFRTYKLFNYSSGSEVDAGTFKIEQLLNGNSRLTITIGEPFRQSGATFEALINTKDEGDNELVFANLGMVDGGTGTLVTDPVVGSGSNLPVKFSDLINKTGYYVKIMNGANVQATGIIK
ncbi:MAG: hypothetical protein KF862_27745 [Chitinophagaceae bacterium]|nr:hypothetical protein [Chitinophagaceae bacterium]